MIETIRLSPAVATVSQARARVPVGPRIWALLVGAAIVPYLNALQAGFVFDDWIQIRGNPALRGELDWFKILAVPLFPGNLYRPLTIGTFALDHAWFGWEAWWFHLVNLLVHAGVTLSVALLGFRLFPRQPALPVVAALLFAVHPIHTEAVTGLVGRAELLAALFSLAAMLSAVRADEQRQPRGQRLWMALALVSFTAALLCKESAITALPLLLLLRVALRHERWWAGLGAELRKLDWLAFAACAGAVFLLRALALSSEPGVEAPDPIDNILASVPAWQRMGTALAIQWDYWSQFVFPLVLSADYSYPQIVPVSSLLNFGTIAGLALLVGTVAWGIRAPGPTGFVLLFPWVAFAVTSNLLFPIGTVRGERLAYFPSVAWCWWLAAVLVYISRFVRPFVALLVVAFPVVAYAGRTYVRNFDWRDQATLFARTAQDAPRSSKALKNHAVALRDAGKFAEALEVYGKAWVLYPFDKGIAFGSGEVADRLGRLPEAEFWYKKTLELEPQHAGALNNLCRLFVAQGRWQEAEDACRSGLRLQAAQPNLWKGLGLAWIGGGKLEQGKEALNIALRLQPNDRALRDYLQGLSQPKEEAGR
ncbi:MAG: hypothetical protein N3C12_06565 [Candidatus Binatia bacterium]|nr:hypothetical protein [Candidatus Binatia bacterium]